MNNELRSQENGYVAMSRTIKSADLSITTAVKMFEILNDSEVEFYPRYGAYLGVIFTDVNPDELLYPEGWYFAKGMFRNKHNSSTGAYSEIPLLRRNGTDW